VRGNRTKNKLRDLASAADLIVKSFDFRCQTCKNLPPRHGDTEELGSETQTPTAEARRRGEIGDRNSSELCGQLQNCLTLTSQSEDYPRVEFTRSLFFEGRLERCQGGAGLQEFSKLVYPTGFTSAAEAGRLQKRSAGINACSTLAGIQQLWEYL
jgi:hypothetical protein